MKRVLHVTRVLDRGGLEEVVAMLVRSLPECGWESAVATVEGGRVADRLRSERPEQVYGAESQSHLGRIRAIARIIREFQADLVHDHFCWYGHVAARIAGVPSVETVHNMYTWLRPGERALLNVQFMLSRHTVFVSEAVRDFTRSRFPAVRLRPWTVVHNGADIDALASAEECRAFRSSLGGKKNDVLIGFAGRLEEPKGIRILMRALEEMSQREVPWQLHLFGDGSLADEIRAVPARRPEVHLHPFQEGIGRLLGCFDIVVLPSFYEGLPLSLLEAMAGGSAVVASRVGGVPEVIRDGIDGLLVPAGDSVLLAALLRRLLRDREERLRLGAAGRLRIADRFSAAAMVRAMDDVYRRVLRV